MHTNEEHSSAYKEYSGINFQFKELFYNINVENTR